MDIAEITAAARAEAEALVAEKDVVETPEPEETPTESVGAWLNRMAEENAEEVVDPSIYGEMTLVPGYEKLTLGICALYDVRYGTLAYLTQLKNSGEVYEPHIVTTQRGIHIIRGFSRREWSSIQRRIIEQTAQRLEKHQEESSNPRWVEADLQMCTEEAIVIAGCVQPQFDKDTVRSLPNGLVSYLSNAILRSSGHDEQQLPPIPLK